MTYVPIIVPGVSPPPSRCPECREVENIKEVCRHCGHEYRYDKMTAGEKWFTFFLIVGIAYVISTVVGWAVHYIDCGPGRYNRQECLTLVDWIMNNQWPAIWGFITETIPAFFDALW